MSEEALKISPKYNILQSASILSVSIAITMGLSLILRMYMPRVLGPEKLGIFYFAESLSMIVFSFLPLGMSIYINRNIPPKPDHAKDILMTMISIEVIAAVVLQMILFAILTWNGNEQESIMTTLIMGAYSAFFIFQSSILRKVFVALNEIKLVSINNVIVKLVLVITAFIAIAIEPSVTFIALAFLISEVVGTALLIRKAITKKMLVLNFDGQLAKDILKISLPFHLAMVVGTIYSQIDMTMVSRYAGDIEVGYFGAAYKLIGVFLLFVPIIQNAFTPALSQTYASKEDGQFSNLSLNILTILVIGSFPLTMVLILFGDFISQLLYGPGFEKSYKILCFLTPILAMTYINTFLGICASLMISAKKIALISGLSTILNVVLNHIFIPIGLEYWGAGGGGLTASLTTLVCEIFMAFLILQTFPKGFFTGRLIYVCLVIAIPCFVSIFFYDDLVSLSFVDRIFILILVPLYMYLTRILTPKSATELFHSLKSKDFN